jgi:predicted ATP-binding protein involved in virulence
LASDRFFVKTLTLENFRCFEKVELGPFDPHFNLLVGENGVGKSSVLLALAGLFSPIATVGGALPEPILLGVEDGRTSLNSSTVIALSRAWRLGAVWSHWGDDFRSERVFKPDPHVDIPSVFRRSADGGEERVDQGLLSPEFLMRNDLLVFYSVRRQFPENGSRRLRSGFFGQQALAYEDWSDAGLDGVALREWFKNQTLREHQLAQRAAGTEFPAPIAAWSHLALVQDAVKRSIEGATNVEYDSVTEDDIVLQMNDGTMQPFRRLSDGQRALVGLVADIGRRACLLNFERFGANTLNQTSGLVLIDELDLHLHPKWQRQIIGALKRIFPKIQFFATTHSPQVIGEARPKEIVLLTPQGQKRPPQSYGMDSNWVLECVMEAEGRDPSVAKEIALLYDEIEDGKFEEARARIANLRKEIGSFGDVEAAESYMWRVEREGDEAAE